MGEGFYVPAPVVGSPYFVSTVNTPLVPLGYQQIVTIGIASGLSPPADAVYALITAEHNIRWRDDGSDPTAAVGMPLYGSWTIWYIGPLTAFKLIGYQIGAVVDVLYYTPIPT